MRSLVNEILNEREELLELVSVNSQSWKWGYSGVYLKVEKVG